MKKYRCPNCGQEAITLNQKMSAIPGISAGKCSNCGNEFCSDYDGKLICWIPLIIGCLLMPHINKFIFKLLVLSLFGLFSLIWSAASADLITKEQFVEKKRQRKTTGSKKK